MNRNLFLMPLLAILASHAALADGAPMGRSRQERLDDILKQQAALIDLNSQLKAARIERGAAIGVTVLSTTASVLMAAKGVLEPLSHMMDLGGYNSGNSRQAFRKAGAAAAVDGASVATIVFKANQIGDLREQIGRAEGQLEEAKKNLVDAAAN